MGKTPYRRLTIKGILFDKDGTLLDYHRTWMPVNWIAARAVAGADESLAVHLLSVGGYDPDRDVVASGSLLAAGNPFEIASAWAAHLPTPPLVDTLTERLEYIFETEGPVSAVAVPGLQDLIARLKMRGLRLGVATSDSERGAHVSLAPFGILEQFDFVAGYDSGHGHKPAPGMAIAFCRATGLAVLETAVVGDNRHDLEMGRTAGAALVVGVLTGTSNQAELSPHADYVLDDVTQLDGLLDGL